MSLIIFCKPFKRKSKLLKRFLRLPRMNRTAPDRETYISALGNLCFATEDIENSLKLP